MIAALVLAAGLSRRMGRPKMVLPWGDTTVIGQVVKTLAHANLEAIYVVTGGASDLVEAALEDFPVQTVHNQYYSNEEMLLSLQIGLANMPGSADGALIVLGDQPQIQERVVRQVIEQWQAHPERIVMPSYRMRRGHPWVLPRGYWTEVQTMEPPQTMRDFHNTHARDIEYVVVETDSILQDLDTPEQYQAMGAGAFPQQNRKGAAKSDAKTQGN